MVVCCNLHLNLESYRKKLKKKGKLEEKQKQLEISIQKNKIYPHTLTINVW